jgi:hypothetical protein
LRHTRRVRRPKHGRSASSTTGRSLTTATLAQLGHDGRSSLVSRCTRIGARERRQLENVDLSTHGG